MQSLFIATTVRLSRNYYILDKEDTIGFVNPRNGSITLYQQSDNVIMHFNQNDRQHDYGSIYRYYDSRDDFYKKMALANAVPDEDVRHKFNFLSNNAVAGSKNIREALEDMVVGIKHEPYKYTTKPNTHVVNARFIVALENDFRPGRKEMSGAPNNGIFHSGEYAQINELNIMGPLSINSSQTISLLAVCKIDYDAVEYSNIAEALREGDDNDDFTYEEGLDMF